MGCTTQAQVGVILNDAGIESPLATVPPLTILDVAARTSSVDVSVEPVEGARDYRIYVLPRSEDVIESGSTVVIRNGLYRCAGDREAPAIPTDGQDQVASGAIASVVSGTVRGYVRTFGDSTLGYVYTSPGPDRTAVYALASPVLSDDNPCYFHRYAASRSLRYTTSESERTTLLAGGWRDDGVAFYAPMVRDERTKTLFEASDADTTLILPAGPEQDAWIDSSTPLFEVLIASAEDTQPLMRVHYTNVCGRDRDVLAAGALRFAQLVQQGSYALPHLHWAPILEPTTLVIEALDRGCPFQGHFSPESRPADADRGRQAWLTLDELRAASETGEVFVNGQHEPGPTPRVIARAFLRVEPQPLGAWDWVETFDTPLATPPSISGPDPNERSYEFESFDARFHRVDGNAHAVGQALGELWFTYGDWSTVQNGMFRLTPRTTAALASDSFVHVRVEIDLVTTQRRFPQILISDRPIPVQTSLEQGYAVFVQAIDYWPSRLEVAFCDRSTWQVDLPCPSRDLSTRPDGSWSPALPVAELAGVDRIARFDVYASTERVYVSLNDVAYGCVDLPVGRVPPGPVTITTGDVLFGSQNDNELEVLGQNVYRFHREHMQIETRRHIDFFGFASGRPAPEWDHTRVPCWPSPE